MNKTNAATQGLEIYWHARKMDAASHMPIANLTFLSVKQLVSKYPFCTQGGLRHWIFHENSNGFNKVIRRVGRKILIHEKLFLEWIDSHKGPHA